MIAGAVKQFYTEVVWKDIDFLLVDMPPGTGDVPLTVFQSIPLDGIIVVTSPQELVSMIVEKAVKMANMMHVPIMGVVENMSYAVCPDCGKKNKKKKKRCSAKAILTASAANTGLRCWEGCPLTPKRPRPATAVL